MMMRFLISCGMAVAVLLSCKPGGDDVTALRLPDSTTTNNRLSTGQTTVQTGQSSRTISSQTNTSGSAPQIMSESAVSEGASDVTRESAVPPSGANVIWWNKINIKFADYVGGAGDIVLEAIKGQPYFDDTFVFIYCTDEALRGTRTFEKVELSMAGTEISNRVFIWVHLNDNREVEFVKKLVSDNIRDRIDQAPNRIEAPLVQ
jgi:hypothetical protein